MTKQELYQKACALPLLPGVYIIRDREGTISYIGKAKRLRTRVSQYFREGVAHGHLNRIGLPEAAQTMDRLAEILGEL